MADDADQYFTTDTESTGSDIDISHLEEDDEAWYHGRGRFLAYLLLVLVVVLAFVLSDVGIGLVVPAVA